MRGHQRTGVAVLRAVRHEQAADLVEARVGDDEAQRGVGAVGAQQRVGRWFDDDPGVAGPVDRAERVDREQADLSFPVEVVGCPIVREADGLAMSSRNVYLTPAEREAATVLHRALLAGAEAVAEGVRSGDAVSAVMGSLIRAEPLAELDYAEVVDPVSLEPKVHLDGEVRLLVAAKLGTPRLLDNIGVTC